MNKSDSQNIIQETQEEINAQIHNHEKKIEEIKAKIKNFKDDIDQKMKLYKDIISIDNTKEEYVLNYLLSKKEIEEKGGVERGVEKVKFSTELEKYQICISDEKYDLHFIKNGRKNARKKFLDFFDEIKKFVPENKKSKADIIQYIRNLEAEIYNTGYHNNKKVTWDNEELYLNCLFNCLITSISSLIMYYFKKMRCSEEVLKDEEYIHWDNCLKEAEAEKEKEKDKKKIEKIELKISIINFMIINTVLLYSTIYKYIGYIKLFLSGIEEAFNKRFGNLLLVDMKDKMLFEDFIHFLSTYKFDTLEYIAYWSEIFVPLDKNKKKEIVNLNYTNCSVKFKMIENGDKLVISEFDEEDSLDTNIYCLSNLISGFKQETGIQKIKWKATRYMKVESYNDNLFVCRTKKYWKKLLIDILRSNVYIAARNSLFDKTQINFFMVDDFISDIIDNNIKFFIYNTTFLGETNTETANIYEYGIYNLDIENHSIALLIYYGFHIIINIHEIGGHLNIKYQYYFTLDNTFRSPGLENEFNNLYSNYAHAQKHESGETLEIKLFGEVKFSLTIKEALFVLNKDNYKLSLDDFKMQFKSCNNKNLKELYAPLTDLLTNLEINVKDLDEKDNNKYPYPLKRKTNGPQMYIETKARHPISFYYKDREEINKFFQSFTIPEDYK